MTLAENMTGSLLVAHPTLRDPNFFRTILFVSHHSEEAGATALVLNRPLEKSLPALPGIPLYHGGPVEPTQILLASLQWRENPTIVAFRAFVGGAEKEGISPDWQPGLRAFAGYAGWNAGQLEQEIADNAWIVVPPTKALIEMEKPADAWRDIMNNSGPMLRLLAGAPVDLWKN